MEYERENPTLVNPLQNDELDRNESQNYDPAYTMINKDPQNLENQAIAPSSNPEATTHEQEEIRNYPQNYPHYQTQPSQVPQSNLIQNYYTGDNSGVDGEMQSKLRFYLSQNESLTQKLKENLSAREQAEKNWIDMQQLLQKERSENQYKIGYLLRQKQEAEAKVYQQQQMIQKYSHALEQLQKDSQNEKQKLNDTGATIYQHKMIEEDLRNQLDALQFKYTETENKLRTQSEEAAMIKNENENLQLDLKSLLDIEQTLRNAWVNSNQKVMEVQKRLSESMNENENMKQDLMQFSKAVEIGSRENESLKSEIQMLKDELLRKHHDNNQSVTSLADKDNEIFTLRAELQRTKAMLSVKQQPSDHGSEFNPSASSLDMLLKQNSDSFASEYIQKLGMKSNKEDTNAKSPLNFDEIPIGGKPGMSQPQSTYEKFGYKGPPTNQNQPNLMKGGLMGQDDNYQRSTSFSYNKGRIQSALPEAPPEKVSKGPRTTQGLPPNSQYKKQEWSPYNP